MHMPQIYYRMDKKLKTIIIDGEPVALDRLREYAQNEDGLKIIEETYRDTDHHRSPRSKEGKHEYIFIREDKEYVKVALDDIRYIAGDAEYLAFHIVGRDRPLREKSSFAAVSRLLSSDFVQVHRSSIVNMRHVSQVGRMYVVLDDGVRVRVSDGHRDPFYAHVDSLTVGKNPG